MEWSRHILVLSRLGVSTWLRVLLRLKIDDVSSRWLVHRKGDSRVTVVCLVGLRVQIRFAGQALSSMAAASSFLCLLGVCILRLTALSLSIARVSFFRFRLLGFLRLSSGGYPGGALETGSGSLPRSKRRFESTDGVIRCSSFGEETCLDSGHPSSCSAVWLSR